MRKRTDKASAEILDQINKASSETEWAAQELDEALRENGVDPDQLVRSVITNIRRLVMVQQTMARQRNQRSSLPKEISLS